MATIYLSSTYEDLKDYRQAVYKALRMAGHQVIAMEDYVAKDQRPVNKCLEDVEKADIYVGLLAFRYGYIPPPQHNNPNGLSITELEYRCAETHEKPCLTFVVNDTTPWSRVFDDAYKGTDKGERIKALREHLLTEKLASQFATPDELSTLVLAAVAKCLATPNAPPSSASFATEKVKVPKGLFIYGDQQTREVIDHDYWIDRYPITNEKYRAFIEAGGYKNPLYWSEDGWEWKARRNITGPEYWVDEEWNQVDHPVVGVSYYEAAAYARWAGKRLPTEQEWEKAARGDKDGRRYPWGEDFDQYRCNSNRSNRGHTTPVTQYQNGVSQYGCYDMVGNVWEWCSGCSGESENQRVLRGGSWFNGPDRLRISNWYTLDAVFRSNYIGFRLAQDIP